METAYLYTGIALAGMAVALALFVWFWWRSRREVEAKAGEFSAMQEELSQVKTELHIARERNAEYSAREASEQEQLRTLIGERATLSAKLDEAERRLKEGEERYRLSQEDLAKREEAMRLQFKNLAGDILEEHSKRFSQKI